jgi:hypothetical protein
MGPYQPTGPYQPSWKIGWQRLATATAGPRSQVSRYLLDIHSNQMEIPTRESRLTVRYLCSSKVALVARMRPFQRVGLICDIFESHVQHRLTFS